MQPGSLRGCLRLCPVPGLALSGAAALLIAAAAAAPTTPKARAKAKVKAKAQAPAVNRLDLEAVIIGTGISRRRH